MFIKILDYGHRIVVVKELTQEERFLSFHYLLDKVKSKLVLFPVFFALLIFYFIKNDYWGYSPVIIFFFFLGSLFVSLSNLSFAVFHSFNKFQLETLSHFVSTIILALGVYCTYVYDSEFYYLLFYPISAIIAYLVSVYLLKSQLTFNKVDKNRKTIPKELMIAFPFAIIAIVDVLFVSVDSYFVERFCTEEDLGIYQGILKIVVGLSLFAVIALSIGTPIVSRLYKNLNRQAYLKINGLFLMFLLSGIVVFVLYYYFNEFFVLLILGPKYLEIVEWDFNMALFALSRYLRFIPEIFFVIAGFHWLRLSIVGFFFLFSSIILMLYLPGKTEKFVMRFMSWTNFAMSFIYTVLFFILLNWRYHKTKVA